MFPPNPTNIPHELKKRLLRPPPRGGVEPTLDTWGAGSSTNWSRFSMSSVTRLSTSTASLPSSPWWVCASASPLTCFRMPKF